MKYALIPLLTEVSQFFEEYGIEDDTEEQVADLHDPYGSVAREAFILLHKIYHTQRGDSNE